MKDQSHKITHRRQSGVSLVELMVAVTISLVLLLGVIELFVSNKQGYALQQSANQLQERGRYATMLLGKSIRMADHWVGADAAAVSGSPTIGQDADHNVQDPCTAAWAADARQGIRGYDGAAAPPLACMGGADYEPDTDMLVLRYAASDGLVPTAELSTGDNASRIFARARVGTRAQLFQGGDIDSDSDFPSDLREDADLVHNHPYRVEFYFIRPCSMKAGTECAASDDGGDPTPTLVRITLEGNTLTQEALVEGVEQLQFSYGVDRSGNDTVDIFRTATEVEANDEWEQVISVRYGMVVRGGELDIETLPTYNFQLPGGFTYNKATTLQDSYQRKLFRDTIQIRNRIRG